MPQFLLEFFSWREAMAQVIWAILITISLRAIMWLARKSLGNREKAFWVILPVSILVVLSAVGYVSRERRSEPKLLGNIDAVMTGTRAEKPSSTSVLLVVSVRNVGMPTTVEGWHLVASFPGGSISTGELAIVPDQMFLSKASGETWVWSGADALYNKTLPIPISTGGMVRGVLIFDFLDIRQHNLHSPGTALELSYVDVLGKRYSVSQNMSVAEGEMKYYPGLQRPHRISPDQPK